VTNGSVRRIIIRVVYQIYWLLLLAAQIISSPMACSASDANDKVSERMQHRQQPSVADHRPPTTHELRQG